MSEQPDPPPDTTSHPLRAKDVGALIRKRIG